MSDRGLKIRIVKPTKTDAVNEPAPAPGDTYELSARGPARAVRYTARGLRRRRRALQVLTLIAIAAVIGGVLYYLAQVGRQEAPVPGDTAATSEREGLILEGKGVDFAIERDGRQVFQIKGARLIQDRDDNVFLETVTVHVERDNGDQYRVESARAMYNRASGDAELEGDVTFTGPGGLLLRSATLTLSRGGRLATTSQSVELGYGRKLAGHAGNLTADLDRDELALGGGVRLASLEGAPRPFRLRADRVQIMRGASQIHAEGAVTVGWDRSVLSALKVSAVLSEDFETLRYLDAHWYVRGHFYTASGLPALVEPEVATTAEGAAGEISGEDLVVVGPPADTVAAAAGTGQLADSTVGGEAAVAGAEVQGPPAELLAAGPSPSLAPALDQAGDPPVRYEAGTLALVLDDNERPQRLDLDGGGGRVSITSGNRQLGERSIEAQSIVARFLDGKLELAETAGGTVLRELPADADRAAAARTSPTSGANLLASSASREARSDRGEARFNASQDLTSVSLFGGVTLSQGNFRATGERADVDLGSAGELELHGAPATLDDPRGRLEAPQIRYRQEQGLVHASQGVRAHFEPTGSPATGSRPTGSRATGSRATAEGGATGQSALLGGALGGASEGPILIDASEAFWYDQPRSFVFLGKVQAWQGENILLAEQLRGDEGQRRFAASGGVKTVWVPRPAASGGAKPVGLERGAAIEITAESLEYAEAAGQLTYTGKVAARQPGRNLACAQLDVALGPERQAESLTCKQDVRLEDTVQGTTVTGDLAVYDLERKQVQVTGERVEMQNRAGNKVTGKVLTYDVTKGTAHMAAARTPPAASPPPATEPDGAPADPPAPAGATPPPAATAAGDGDEKR